MKKLLIISMLMVYLICTSGISIHVHYCNGKIKHVSLVSGNKEKNCCGNKEKSKGCCHDQETQVKIGADHQSSEHSKPAVTFANVSFPILPEQILILFTTSPNPDRKAPPQYKPPIAALSPLYLNHRALLI